MQLAQSHIGGRSLHSMGAAANYRCPTCAIALVEDLCKLLRRPGLQAPPPALKRRLPIDLHTGCHRRTQYMYTEVLLPWETGLSSRLTLARRMHLKKG